MPQGLCTAQCYESAALKGGQATLSLSCECRLQSLGHAHTYCIFHAQDNKSKIRQHQTSCIEYTYLLTAPRRFGTLAADDVGRPHPAVHLGQFLRSSTPPFTRLKLGS